MAAEFDLRPALPSQIWQSLGGFDPAISTTTASTQHSNDYMGKRPQKTGWQFFGMWLSIGMARLVLKMVSAMRKRLEKRCPIHCVGGIDWRAAARKS